MAATASEKKLKAEFGIVDLVWTELEEEGLNLPNVPVKPVVRRAVQRFVESAKRRTRPRK